MSHFHLVSSMETTFVKGKRAWGHSHRGAGMTGVCPRLIVSDIDSGLHMALVSGIADTEPQHLRSSKWL